MLSVYIFIGGGIGSVLRCFLIAGFIRYSGNNFPYGTVAVNIIGSFLMGIIVGYLSRAVPDNIELRSFLVVGILGGFTTFSAFSFDIITLLQRGETTQALLYVISSVVFSVLAVFSGLTITKL